FQLSIIPGLARHGTTRAQLEAVRVHPDERGTGLGTELVLWAEHEARRRGCALLQLTSDATRAGPHRFYARLGYRATHVGLKRDLGCGTVRVTPRRSSVRVRRADRRAVRPKRRPRRTPSPLCPCPPRDGAGGTCSA